MPLYLFITCVPLILLFLKPLLSFPPNPPNPPLLLLKALVFLALPKPRISQTSPLTAMNAPLKRKALSARVESVEDFAPETTTFLDLPELALDCILEKLPPRSLASMAGVCSAMRVRCVADRLWERHMRAKWGFLIGQAARKVWQWRISTTKPDSGSFKQGRQRGLMRLLSLGWPFSWIRSKVDEGLGNGGIDDDGFEKSSKQRMNPLPVDSVMAWYLALETGKFSFPAQVYNRENGHVGFMLSCYDAEVSYDSKNDTFQARYPPHGRRAMAIETSVPWGRLRAPVVETPPHDLYVSECLHELRPGDHIEIQWRRNKEFPYGWWYGMVGHLEPCDGNQNYCTCHDSDTVVLDFNHYTPGSRWRHTTISRRDHREEGNEADGFYGGIRKLGNEAEVSTWKRLWPTESLE